MSRGVQAWGLRARVPWVEPGELTYIYPHARGLMGKGSPRVCIPLLCRAPIAWLGGQTSQRTVRAAASAVTGL